jgi:phosphoglucosamine mutase
MALRFGTDGVRGAANTQLTPELALALGRATVAVLGDGPVVIGRDTRRSGPMIEAALAAGIASAGADVELLGVVPTPTVAYVSEHEGIAGAVISASHNAFGDNGIKLFAPGGRKLADGVEDDIEVALEAELAAAGRVSGRPEGAGVGAIAERAEGITAYLDHLVAALGGRDLAGLRVAIDCANGAAWALGPEVFRRLGAQVDVLHAEPDGMNINAGCGATHPDPLAARVAAGEYDLGLAFDGDADRLIAVDHTGAVVDGDHILAVCTRDLRAQGRLTGDTVVVTVMANLGFRQAMEREGVRVVETAVGDRYVLEAIEAGGYALGGEQSGHVIFRDLATTGDGLLTGLVLADVVRRSGRALGDLAASSMTRLPQVLVNVRVSGSAAIAADRIRARVAEAAAGLGARGRVLVRPSGTEPLVRVMVEAPTQDEAEHVAQSLAAAVGAPATSAAGH